jgi:RluA family pseudouridine synthase
MEQLIDVLHEDDSLIVINKPSGILTQAPPGVDSLETRVREYLRWKHRATGKVYVGVPHRLDRPVSGAIVFALRRKFANRLSKQFERREVEKSYWALLCGRVEPPSGRLEDQIRKIPGRALAQVVAADHLEGKNAVLHFVVLQRANNLTWVEIRLETGRTHQIRLQWSSRGHSVLGDEIYGSTARFGPETTDARDRQIALHAVRLSFLHPKSREPIDFSAPVPDTWLRPEFELDNSFA